MSNTPRLHTSRRGFCTGLIAAVPVLALSSRVHAQAEPTKPVDEASQMATALGYKSDASKVDLVKFPKRKEAGGDKQFCDNCMFMQKTGLKADGAEGVHGKCALFMDGLVNAKGWCNSWAAKPAM